MIATDSLHFTEYQDEMKWSLDKYLYEKLANNQAMRDTDTTMSNFYFNHQNSIFQDFNNVYDSLGATFTTDSTLRANIATHGQTIETSSQQIAINDSILGTDTTLSSGQRVALKSANEILLQTISSNTEYINTALQLLKDNRLLDLQTVMQFNLGITTTKVMEINQRTINNVFMSTLAKGMFDFTTQQISDIYDIAIQCPVSGGSAVYQARFMYELIYSEMEYDDELSCLQGGIVLRKAKGEIASATYIYPNPASSSATLRYNSDTNGLLDIFDVVGNKVLTFNLLGKQHEFTFEISTFANGVYHYRVSFPNQDVVNGKFSVVR